MKKHLSAIQQSRVALGLFSQFKNNLHEEIEVLLKTMAAKMGKNKTIEYTMVVCAVCMFT